MITRTGAKQPSLKRVLNRLDPLKGDEFYPAAAAVVTAEYEQFGPWHGLNRANSIRQAFVDVAVVNAVVGS